MLIFQVLWVVMAYILGSIPFGVVIAKTFCKIDPREAGSHSSGATNVSRLCGLPYGIATLACDVLKGTFPVWGAFWLSPDPFFISLAGLACVLGHLAPAGLLRPGHAGYLEKRLCIAWLSQPSGFSAHLFDICWFVAMGAAELVPVHHCLCQTSRKYFPAQERHGKALA